MATKDSKEKKTTTKKVVKKLTEEKVTPKKSSAETKPTTKKPDGVLVAIGAFVALTLLAIALSVSMVLQNSNQDDSVAAVVSEVSVENDSVLGDPNAPITIVEFSDYSCPFCARHFSETLPQIKSEYIDSGMVKLVYRDFAFKGERSQNLAASAECAGEKSDADFYKVHDYIFSNPGVDTEGVIAFGAENGLGADFAECVRNGDMLSEVQADMADAQSYGVNSTPTFFINGEKIVGAQAFDAFKQVIDKKLAEME